MFPDNKFHGANMGPIWGRQDPGGPHFGPMNFDIWVVMGANSNTYIDKDIIIMNGFSVLYLYDHMW